MKSNRSDLFRLIRVSRKRVFAAIHICLFAGSLSATPVSNIASFYKSGQVFITWDNLTIDSVYYTLYRSSTPIVTGSQLSSAQNLGSVRDSSALNWRLTSLSGGIPIYLKIDSAGSPLASNKGLFVATSTVAGQFYYAVTTRMYNSSVEDTTIVPGSNSLTNPVSETVAMPWPVWQESRTIGSQVFEIYVQFVTKVTSAIYPQMTNVGWFPFHFAVVKGGSIEPHPVTFWLHSSDANFLGPNYVRGIGDPNEWIVTIDDWLPNDPVPYSIFHGFWKGFDIYSGGPPAAFPWDTLYNYTAARIAHTIDWCLRNFPLDSTRTYLTGWSMGAIGSIFTSMVIPSKIAAIFIYAPRFNVALPIPTNPSANNQTRALWGDYLLNVPTNEGFTRNERLDANFLADTNRLSSLPVIYTFCGRSDLIVGWDEKPTFYQTGEADKHGMFHFWGTRDHQLTYTQSQWQPSFPDFSFFLRYRTNRSYPAFSGCSINDDPGNGDPGDGDPIGTINGHLDWSDVIVDTTTRWEATLHLKDLLTVNGPLIAPDSATTNVTLRRLQEFSVPNGATVVWQNLRHGAIVQEGGFTYQGGLITVPNVKVYKDSSTLKISYQPTSVEGGQSQPNSYLLAQNYPNPFNPSTVIKYNLPSSTHVSLKVYDILGQEVRILVDGIQNPGFKSVTFSSENLGSGVYFYRLVAHSFANGSSYMQMKKMLLLK